MDVLIKNNTWMIKDDLRGLKVDCFFITKALWSFLLQISVQKECQIWVRVSERMM